MAELNWTAFLTQAIERTKFVLQLDNELARLSALNGLLGFLEGRLMGYQDEQQRDEP